MYKYLFGPVPSRRLGMSLGVDLVPKKVCSLDCVYCEVGKTTLLTMQRKEYIKLDKVKNELKHFFSNNPDPDYITFSGSGEPTLNIGIGDIISYIKEIKPLIPVAVLTNGTLLSDPEVRKALSQANLVLPSLDSATEQGFGRINRPAQGLNISTYLQGVKDFANEFKGDIWLEVFILPGYNDSPEEIHELKKALVGINPKVVQLNTLDRPGTLSGLRGATHDELQQISDMLELNNVVIIAASAKRKNILSYRKDIENAIIETISRRPCTLDDLTTLLGKNVSEINKYLDVLEADKKIEAVEQSRGVFYQLSEKYEN